MPLWVLLIALGGTAELARSRLERSIEADVRRILGGEAKVDLRARVRSDLRASFTLAARDFSVDGMPFYCDPDSAGDEVAGFLRLELRNFRLRGLRVSELRADIPRAAYDSDRAFRDGRIRLRSTGEGPGSVRIEAAALAEYLVLKFPILRDVTVNFENGHIEVTGGSSARILGERFRVRAELRVATNRTLNLENLLLWVDDQPVSEANRRAAETFLNPVLDVDRDLGLAGAVDIERLAFDARSVTAFGRVRIPKRPKVAPKSSP
jgi:hypothetical protein